MDIIGRSENLNNSGKARNRDYSGFSSMDLDPKTEKSILKQAGIK
jgi:hypothetical protein